ncbi:hypothetical protein SK128_021556 [Halocaridina rubra]|uniref:Uncharacterized protein n=1 Tax=Halocaridina rubra TaxID=373956 RepID=A0AAN8WF83_HALRR
MEEGSSPRLLKGSWCVLARFYFSSPLDSRQVSLAYCALRGQLLSSQCLSSLSVLSPLKLLLKQQIQVVQENPVVVKERPTYLSSRRKYEDFTKTQQQENLCGYQLKSRLSSIFLVTSKSYFQQKMEYFKDNFNTTEEQVDPIITKVKVWYLMAFHVRLLLKDRSWPLKSVEEDSRIGHRNGPLFHYGIWGVEGLSVYGIMVSS